MSKKARITLTTAYTAKLDEAFASGDEEKLRTALHSLAKQITKSAGDDQVTKDDITATEFVMEHIWKNLPKYRVLEGSRFSSWAFRVLRLRFIDWTREQKVWLRKRALVYGVDTEGEAGGEGESAGDHLDRLCLGGLHRSGSGALRSSSGKIPAPKRFGKRELQKLRAIKAVQMWRKSASKVEIAALLSMGKKKAVKPSSVPASVSRWMRRKIYLENLLVR